MTVVTELLSHPAASWIGPLNVSTTMGSAVWRTPHGPERWAWSTTGLGGYRRGTAMSKAVAEVRAKRALEELRGR